MRHHRLFLLSLGTVQMFTLAGAGAGQAIGFEAVFPIMAAANAVIVLVLLGAWSYVGRVRISRADATQGCRGLAADSAD